MRLKTTSCGCCSLGCTCQLHRAPGAPIAVCPYHALVPHPYETRTTAEIELPADPELRDEVIHALATWRQR